MQNDKPKSKTPGVAESTDVPVTENVPTRSVAVSVEKVTVACAVIGPASSPTISNPGIFDFIKPPPVMSGHA
jgi:hypothetical protein